MLRSTKSMVAVAMLTTLAVCGAGAVPGVGLTRDGIPVATIVLAESPTRAAQLGAFELQHHVQLITGARLPIVREPETVSGTKVYVGDSFGARRLGVKSSRLGEQEYVVVFRPGAVVLLGVDKADFGEVVYDMKNPAACSGLPGNFEERGSLDAVYELLERYCGVRWFNPTELGMTYPERKTLTVGGEEVRRRPFMRYRAAIWAGPGQYDSVVALWQPADAEYKAWDAVSYPTLHQQYPSVGQYNAARTNFERLFLLRRRNGGAPAACNHSLYGYYTRFSAAEWEGRLAQAADEKAREAVLAQKAQLFEEDRPEFFAQGYEGQPPQLCYTNPALVQQVAQDARDYYDGKLRASRLPWPGLQLPNPFPVEPMDNSSFCKCEKCRALYEKQAEGPHTGAHSDYFFSFVNAVARELQKTHPGKDIITLAYGSHEDLPSFPLEPNVIVEFCFSANRMPAEPGYEKQARTLREWARKANRPLYLWNYDLFPRYFGINGKYNVFPGFFAHTIGSQMRMYRDLNVQGIFFDGYGQEVEAYVTFKLMDNPSLSVDDLLRDYFTGMYGPAGKPMREMYEAMERTYCDAKLRPKAQVSGPALAWGVLGTEERMRGFQRLLDQAKALAQTDLQRARIAAFEHGTWSYMTAGRAKYVERTQAPIPTVTVPRVAPGGGEAAKVEWAKAAPLGGPWYERGGGNPAKRTYEARALHDGEYLYLELTDNCDVKQLVVSPMVSCYDDWELFVGKQRGMPYRYYASGPTGLTSALSYGEVNFRMTVPLTDSGWRVVSDTSAGDKWVTRMVFPLATMVPGGVKAGESVYLNIVRVMNPVLAGAYPYGIDTWVSHCTVHEVDRLGELKLAK